MTSVLRRTWLPGPPCGAPGWAGWALSPSSPLAVPLGWRDTQAHAVLPGPWQECLSRLLSPCGPVRSVELQEKPDLAESPKEPQSKFFQPKPIPVSLRAPGSAGMGPGG